MFGPVRLAALDRWLHYTVTTIDRFHCTSNVWASEAGCFRQVAALYNDHYRQVPLYIECLGQGRLAALDRWLHYTVTTIDRFHCTSNVWASEAGCFRQVAALYNDHYKQVPLYIKCLGQGRLAAVDKWLHIQTLPCILTACLHQDALSLNPYLPNLNPSIPGRPHSLHS